MKAIVNGRIVAPHAVIRGKVLLYDERVIGIVDPGETPEGVETLDAITSSLVWWTCTSTATWARMRLTAASRA